MSSNSGMSYKFDVATDTLREMSKATTAYQSLVNAGVTGKELEEAQAALEEARRWFHAANKESARGVRL
jgi:hypothetical protein